MNEYELVVQENDIMKDTIKELEQKLAESEKKYELREERLDFFLRETPGDSVKRIIKLEQKLSEALEVIRFYGGTDNGFEKRGEKRARDFLKKHEGKV